MNALPSRLEAIPYRYGKLNPRWKARIELWTPEQWHNWRLKRVALVIRKQKVISQSELESRVCDFVPRGNPRVEPHHIKRIKNDLDLVTIADDPVPFYSRRKMTKLNYLGPLGEKQRIHRGYLEIANQELCGAVGERVASLSIREAALQHRALAITPHTLGSVSEIDGYSTGGSMDTYCYYAVPSSGLPRDAIPIGVEVKNIRGWIYPESKELWQAIRAATELNCIPVLVTRRIHVTTGRFCKSVGMAVCETQRQYFAPQLREDPRLLDAHRDLYFQDVLPWDGADRYTTKFFASTLPSMLDRTVARYTQFRDLLRSYALDGDLHADGLPHEQRTATFHGFRAEFLELSGETQVGW